MAKQIEMMSADVELVSKLGDQPNQENGLTAEELKAVFDSGSKRLKEYINETLVPAVNELAESDGESIKKDQLPKTINAALDQAKESGEFDGGYYVPIVDQINASTMRIEFTPSNNGTMPAVKPISINLPAGPNGNDGFSPDVTVTEIYNGYRVTITDRHSTQSFDILNGVVSAPMVVTVNNSGDGGPPVSHSAKQVYNHVQAGGSAVFEHNGEYFELTWCNEGAAVFTCLEAKENEVEVRQFILLNGGAYDMISNGYISSKKFDDLKERVSNLENIPNANGVSF